MPRTRPPMFPELEKQILMHGMLKLEIAEALHIAQKTLSRKLTGQAEFTLHEVEQIAAMFPGAVWETLFERMPREQDAAKIPPAG